MALICIVLSFVSCKKDPPVFEETNVLVKYQPVPFDSTFAIQVFPNPVIDTLTVQFTLSDSRTVSWMLYNMVGVNVANGVLGNLTPAVHQFSVPFVNIPSGVYFLILDMGNIRKTIKIVKS